MLLTKMQNDGKEICKGQDKERAQNMRNTNKLSTENLNRNVQEDSFIRKKKRYYSIIIRSSSWYRTVRSIPKLHSLIDRFQQ
jgi:hypothetical protein